MKQPFRSEEEATSAMFRSADHWPHPFLPVKNRGTKRADGFPLLGIAFHPANATGFTIHVGALHEVRVDPSKAQIVRFDTVEEAMAAGWVVD